MTQFNTYVINLKKDKDKLAKITKDLNNIKFNFIRFDAINGRHTDNKILKKYVSNICNNFCPDAVIGCGLSHILLAKYFLKNDPNNFALILEDDAVPLYSNMKQEIIKCVNNIDKNWDIIKLYCFGFCNYNANYDNKLLTGSNAAYLLSKNGAKKISQFKLYNHIDIQYNLSNLSNLRMYKNKYPLFSTYFDKSSTSGKNYLIEKLFNFKINNYSPPAYFFLQEKALKIPFVNIELSVYHFLFIILLLLLKKYKLL